MHVFLMVAVLLTSEGAHIMGRPFPSLAACEKAKAETTAEALKAGITNFGLTCSEVIVGTAS